MIHDYLVSGLHTSPQTFGREFYLHYPKVAFGAWPPGFHVVESIWMLLFSPARLSVLLFVASITTIWATTTYCVARAEFGAFIGASAAALLVLNVAVQISSASVMADGLVALFDLWAMLAFARYWDEPTTRRAILFGVLATCSSLTKENGLALLLVPWVSVVVTSDYRRLRTANFWYPMLMVLVIAGPWAVYSAFLMKGQIAGSMFGPGLVARHTVQYAAKFLKMLGWGITPFAVLGLYREVVVRKQLRRGSGLWIATFSLLVAVLLFHFLLPQGDTAKPRYLLAALPPAILFFCAGVQWVGTIFIQH